MIIRNHAVLQIIFTSWMMGFILCSTNETAKSTDNSTTLSKSEDIIVESINASHLENKPSFTPVTVNDSSIENAEDLIKSHRRAASTDTARSVPWVSVYNRPPGSKAETVFKYGTRGNTSAHAKGDEWNVFKKDKTGSNTIDRVDESKPQDILRVKPKAKDGTQNAVTRLKKPATLPTKPSTKIFPTASTTVTQPDISTTTVEEKAQKFNKSGFIVWTSNDGATSGGWTLDDPIDDSNKNSVPVVTREDGSKWKVIGEGGDDGWQVVDDNGDVEWKIEYDDGEWRVTSTGDIPEDAEWVDPDYFWGSSDGSLAEDDEYNSWPADDYNYAPWVGATAYSVGNTSDNKSDGSFESTSKSIVSSIRTDLKTSTTIKDKFTTTPTPTVFGARKKLPNKKLSSVQDRTDVADDTSKKATDKPLINSSEQGKSWGQSIVVPSVVPKRIEAYGSKTWEADNSGWNSKFGEETWVAANKDFPAAPWIPKASIGKSQDATKSIAVDITESPISAWGTGYGTKTWKGNAWDSNVVWKTGFGGVPSWTDQNNTVLFPDNNEAKDDQQKDKKNVVWSQPALTKDSKPNSKPKPIESYNQRANGVRIKWPTKPKNGPYNQQKNPPSRRTEEESWGDDASVGGVVWKSDAPSSVLSTENISTKPDVSGGKLWQTGGWKVKKFNEEQKLTTIPWKSNTPIKSSNLISVKLDTGDDSVSISEPTGSWNNGQWPSSGEINGFPYWIFNGCKLKCKSSESDASDDTSNKDSKPDTADDDSSVVSTDVPPTTISKEWPIQQTSGKSWKPPVKSWRPPSYNEQPPTKSWRPPPTKSWKPPMRPNVAWKKPLPPQNVWKNTPTSTTWIETTPLPTTTVTETPTVPPATFPPSMKRKKATKSWKPPPTKSWKPPPIKSWNPPPYSGKSWRPSIATPIPDAWSMQTKPDCKDVTETPQPTSEPEVENNDVDANPPQIIIITKLPKNSKIAPPQPDDRDTKDDSKGKPPNYPWKFPSRKNSPKSSKNRKDKIIPVKGKPKRFPSPPGKYFKSGNKGKSWNKNVPAPTFIWPANKKIRKGPLRKPITYEEFMKYVAANQKKSKSSSWKQMIKKWING